MKLKINSEGRWGGTAVYPGGYNVLPAEVAGIKKALRNKFTRIIAPPVKIFERSDHYRIELVAPGLHKEDFFITTSSSRVFVSAVVHQPVLYGEDNRANKSQSTCLRRIILLPADADPDFAEAGYLDGILHICLFKTPYPGRVGNGHIVVY